LEPEAPRDFDWILIGPHGLRAGWSILLFAATFYLFQIAAGIAFFAAGLVDESSGNTPAGMLAGELSALLALAGATALMALIERRRFLSYNLTGPRRPVHFLSGLVAGFAALSLLVGTLAGGGWMRFGAAQPAGLRALSFAAIWGGVFLVVGLFEEGLFRCYALVTLARGINFWWALAAEIGICLYAALRGGEGVSGVYAAAAIGLVPCLILHQRAATRCGGGFWQAAWVTSTFFGFYHTSNPGESGIGIFAAAFIGFVFCVSVRTTGSAWWAIGCHAAWDWAETFFYGAADSGLTPHGCYLTSTPAGNPLWSGGDVGPEGSVLVLGAILFLLALVLVYGRWSARAAPDAA
jgi:hypothetical protein